MTSPATAGGRSGRSSSLPTARPSPRWTRTAGSRCATWHRAACCGRRCPASGAGAGAGGVACRRPPRRRGPRRQPAAARPEEPARSAGRRAVGPSRCTSPSVRTARRWPSGSRSGPELRDARSLRVLEGPQTRGGEGAWVRFSPDGRLLAVGSVEGYTQLWDVATRRPVGARLAGHEAPVLAAEFSPDGRTLATSAFDGTVILWDVASRRSLGTLAGRYRRDGSPVLAGRSPALRAARDRAGAPL